MEFKELFEVLGLKIPEDKKVEELTKEDFMPIFQSEYVGKKVAHDDPDIKNVITGKIIGAHSTLMKNIYEDIGVKFEDGEIKENGRVSVDKVIEVGKRKANELITGLKEAGTKDYDTKLKALNDQYEKKSNDYKLLQGELTEVTGTLTTKEKEFEGFKQSFVLDSKKKEALSNLQFSETADKYRKKGFIDTFFETYDIELADDSEDGTRITDKVSKNRVIENNKFVSLETLLRTEAAKAKILKVAENGNGQHQQRQVFKGADGKERRLNPNAVRIANGEAV